MGCRGTKEATVCPEENVERACFEMERGDRMAKMVLNQSSKVRLKYGLDEFET